MNRYCRRTAQVIFAQLVVTTVFIVLGLVWPVFFSMDYGIASPALWFAMFLAATGGWSWAHGHECGVSRR